MKCRLTEAARQKLVQLVENKRLDAMRQLQVSLEALHTNLTVLNS